MAGEDKTSGKNPPGSKADGQETRTHCADWATAYPSGIPLNYNMAHHAGEKYPEYYIESYLPMTFYTEAPEDLKAMFSTKNGQHQSRRLEHVLARRELKLWDAEKIQNTANSIRKKFWASMRDMPEPRAWADLYDYFDAHDIYYEGALNLWNLICQLWQENQNLLTDLYRTMACEISIWADEWLENPEHKEALLAWDAEETIDILNILSGDEMKDIRDVNDVDLVLVRATLTHCRNRLKEVVSTQPKHYPGNSLKNNWGEVNMWLTGQPASNTVNGLFKSEDRAAIVCSSMYKDQATNTDEVVRAAAAVATEVEFVVEGTTEAAQNGGTQPGLNENSMIPLQPIPERGNQPKSSEGNASSKGTSQPSADKASDKTPVMPDMAFKTKSEIASSMPKPHLQQPSGLPSGASHVGGYAGFPQLVSDMTLNNSALSYNGTQFFRPHHSNAAQNVVVNLPRMNNQQSSSAMLPTQQPALVHASDMSATQNSSYRPKMPKNTTRPADNLYKDKDNHRLSSLHAPRQRPSTNTAAAGSRAFTGAPVQSKAYQIRNNDSRGTGPSGGADLYGGWIMDGTHDLHGPTHRRSPQKHDDKGQGQSQGQSQGQGQGQGRQRAWSTLSSTGAPCANSGPADTCWDYFPCDCSQCEARNRSVYVSFRPLLQTTLPIAVVQDTIHREMSRYGDVEKVAQSKKPAGMPTSFNVRFRSAVRIMEAANAPNVVSRELSCSIITSALHRSNYGAEWARMNNIPVVHGGYGRPRDSLTQQNVVYGGGQRPRLMSNTTVASQGSPRVVSGGTPTQVGIPMVRQLAMSTGYFPPAIGHHGPFFPPQVVGPVGAMASMGPRIPVGAVAQPHSHQYPAWFHPQPPAVSMPHFPHMQGIVPPHGLTAFPEAGARFTEGMKKAAVADAAASTYKEDWRSKPPSEEALSEIKREGEHTDVVKGTISPLSKACTVRLPGSPGQSPDASESKKERKDGNRAGRKTKASGGKDLALELGDHHVQPSKDIAARTAAQTTYASMLKGGSNQSSPANMGDHALTGTSAKSSANTTAAQSNEPAQAALAEDPFINAPALSRGIPTASSGKGHGKKGKAKQMATRDHDASSRQSRQSRTSSTEEGNDSYAAKGNAQHHDDVSNVLQEQLSHMPRNFSKSSVASSGKPSKKKGKKKKHHKDDTAPAGGLQQPTVDPAGELNLSFTTIPEHVDGLGGEPLLSPSKRKSDGVPEPQLSPKRPKHDEDQVLCQPITSGHPDITVTSAEVELVHEKQPAERVVATVQNTTAHTKSGSLRVKTPDSSLELPAATSPAISDEGSVAGSWHTARSRQTSAESLELQTKPPGSIDPPATPPIVKDEDASPTPRRVVSAGSTLDPKAREFTSPAAGLAKRASAVNLRGLVPLGLGAQQRAYHHQHQRSIVSDTSSRTITPGCSPKNKRDNKDRSDFSSPPPEAKPSFALRPAAASYMPSTRAPSAPRNAFSAQHESIEEQLTHARQHDGGKQLYQLSVGNQSYPSNIEPADSGSVDGKSTENSCAGSAAGSDAARSRQPKHKKSKVWVHSNKKKKTQNDQNWSQSQMRGESKPKLESTEFPALPGREKERIDATTGPKIAGTLTKLASPFKSVMGKLSSGGVPKGEEGGSSPSKSPAKVKDAGGMSADREDDKQ
ncbi:hypothetical protein ACHAQH_004448 [Verticillium albo-atrum]